jgi:hypothetical protein
LNIFDFTKTLWKKKYKEKPSFSEHIFWDVHIDKLNYEKQKVFIIERVLVYGLEDDERQLYDYYKANTIKKVALKSRNLNKSTACYLSVLFNIPKERFACFKEKQWYEP